MIKLVNVNKKYQEDLILKDINLSIKSSGFYVLKGESGCGKTTLLNIISKSEDVTSGTVETKGKIATIYQNYDLIDELTVQENICFLNKTDDYFNLIVNKLNIDNLLMHYPHELSGGQKQRVGIARAIYFNPDIILCDEPTEALDFENKLIVLDFLKELSKDKIVLVVTHDVELVNDYADVIYNIENHILNGETKHELNNSLTYNNNSLIVNSKKIIDKINRKANIRNIIIMALSILIFVSLFIWTTYIFKPNDSYQVLNIDKIYIEGKEVDRKIKNRLDDIVGIVEFKNAIIDDKNYDVNVFPVVDNEDFEFTLPQANEVIINQNLNNVLNIGDSFNLKYLGIEGLSIKEFKVVDIIYEDTTLNNIYYNLDLINETFSNENNYLEIEFSEYIYHNSSLKQATLAYDELEKFYEISSNITNNDVFNPTYNERLQIKTRTSIYKAFSIVFEIIYVITIIILIITLNAKDNQKKIKSYALLLSFNESREHIINLHRYNKIYYYLMLSLFIIPIIVISLFIFKDIIILMVVYIILTISYLLGTSLNLNKFNKTNVHSILKEE